MGDQDGKNADNSGWDKKNRAGQIPECGHAEGQYHYGIAMMNGEGRKPNPLEGSYWFWKAAKHGRIYVQRVTEQIIGVLEHAGETTKNE